MVEEFTRECLSMKWFKNRLDAKILSEGFRAVQGDSVSPESRARDVGEGKLTLSQSNLERPSSNGRWSEASP